MNRLFLTTAAIIGLFASQSVLAATATATIAATASVATVCTLNTTALTFPAVAVAGVTDATSTVNVTCTSGGAYNVAIDPGQNAAAGQRNLKSGSNILAYGLFSDVNHATAWGNTAGTDTVAGIGNGGAQTLTVYGEIAAGQTLITGNYTDTVTVTVTY